MPRRSTLALALAFAAVAGCGGSGDRPRAEARETAPAAGRTGAGDDAARPARSRGVRLVGVGRFRAPLYVAAVPGDRRRIYVVEQGGRIMVVRAGRILREPFLDLRGQVRAGGEQGLLGLAFAPDGRFYVDYTDRNGDTRIVEYRRSRASADRADLASRRELLFIDQPEANHNGGQLAFGPDGLLYIGMGDGGGGGDQHGRIGNGQSLDALLGKILRIDPRPGGGRPYRVPRDNPFVGRAGARGEIWAYGLRNPWRFSFDRATGDLTVGDVGQDAVEEIDFRSRRRAPGTNFGWRVFEGARRFGSGAAPGAVGPVIQRTHDDGWCSITGGYVVRDPGLPALRGRYVYGDYCLGRLRAARLSSAGARGDRDLRLRVPALSSFGEDARGRVYVTSLDGPVYRLAPR
jgi:glucose/arabinose dehydrogenase